MERENKKSDYELYAGLARTAPHTQRLTHTCRVHPIALFPVHFYIENCCHGELCTQYFITLSYNLFFQFTLWKENFLRSMEHRKKNFTKFYQNQETTLFFRNDNSRVYTTSTMHLKHFWHTICIRAIWLVMLQYNLYPPSFLQIVRFMSLFARVILLLLLTVSNEFHAKN